MSDWKERLLERDIREIEAARRWIEFVRDDAQSLAIVDPFLSVAADGGSAAAIKIRHDIAVGKMRSGR